MRRQVQKREETKMVLVNTALQLFSRKGYDITSIRAIATDACVSQGLLYNYFGSKEALLLEIFHQGTKILRSLSPTLKQQVKRDD